MPCLLPSSLSPFPFLRHALPGHHCPASELLTLPEEEPAQRPFVFVQCLGRFLTAPSRRNDTYSPRFAGSFTISRTLLGVSSSDSPSRIDPFGLGRRSIYMRRSRDKSDTVKMSLNRGTPPSTS